MLRMLGLFRGEGQAAGGSEPQNIIPVVEGWEEGRRRGGAPSYGVEARPPRSSSPRKEEGGSGDRETVTQQQIELARQIDGHRATLQDIVTSSALLPTLLELCRALAPVLESGARSQAPLSASVQNSLAESSVSMKTHASASLHVQLLSKLFCGMNHLYLCRTTGGATPIQHIVQSMHQTEGLRSE